MEWERFSKYSWDKWEYDLGGILANKYVLKWQITGVE